jgi:aminoglycoside phosphotransferase (APT) family kinase protein
MTLIDQAGTPRAGEELDAGVVEAFMKKQLPKLAGACRIKQFPGGASNLTYLVEFEEQSFVLRRPPFGTKAKSAHDMGREFRVMQRLKPVYPYVPNMIAYCEDESILGAPFYIMERLVGFIPRADLPAELGFGPEQHRDICLEFVDKLVELHRVDYQKAGLADLGKPDGYVTRQVEGWSQRYLAARTDNVPDYAGVRQWLHEHKPEQIRTCVIHNDYRFDNIVFDPDHPTRAIGVLDWEMATLGDPLMDLGNSLAYWVEAGDDPLMQKMRRQPTHLPGMLTRDEIVQLYLKKMDLAPVDFTWYRVYGLFRLAVIAQQIYYRFAAGQTKDQRFAQFHLMVAHLEKLSQTAIKG